MRWLACLVGMVLGSGVGWWLFAPERSPAVSAPAVVAVQANDEAGEPPLGPERGEPVAVEREIGPEVQAAFAPWIREGKASAAAAALRKTGAGEAAREIEAIDALRRAGQGALLAGELEEAEARWREALERERRLLPRGTQSLPATAMRAALAEALHDRARLHEERAQLREAWAAWARASEWDPTHVDSIAGLQRLELRAARLLASDPGCETLAEILATTRPGSGAHRAASARAEACGAGGLSAIPLRWLPKTDRP